MNAAKPASPHGIGSNGTDSRNKATDDSNKDTDVRSKRPDNNHNKGTRVHNNVLRRACGPARTVFHSDGSIFGFDMNVDSRTLKHRTHSTAA